MVENLIIPSDYSEQRVDNFFFRKFKNIPKSHIYKAIRKGEVRVNKKRVKADSRVQPGDVIRIPPFFNQNPDEILVKASPYWMETLKKSVIYEDESILAINKPWGLPVHGDKGSYGVLEVMKEIYPHYPDLELAHRLDKETSGCLLMAKKRSMLKHLHQAFREGRVKKTYYALTLGHWKKSELLVNLPLSRREKKGPECQVVVDKINGKESLTRFEVVKGLANASLVLAYPETGRTHQIRVHCKHLGHPLAGDTRYGDALFNEGLRKKGLNRLFLHAFKLKLSLPNYPSSLKLECALPLDLQNLVT